MTTQEGKKFDGTVRKNIQQGSDPMDIGAVRGDWSEQYQQFHEEDGDVNAVGYYGYKGKGKCKGKGKTGASVCYNCGSPEHFARECPYSENGKGKGDKGKGKGGFQGVCYNCGEFGHPARECPALGKGEKGKGKGKSKGKGKGIWQVDGEEGDWNWEQGERAGEIGLVSEEGWQKVPQRRT